MCRQPFARYHFDFANGRVLAGLSSRGRGCKSRHEVIEIIADVSGLCFTLNLRLGAERKRNYELLYPFTLFRSIFNQNAMLA